MGEAERDDGLDVLAIKRIYRVRRFKLHLVAFAVGIPLLTTLWLLTEYFEENTWPSRFASGALAILRAPDRLRLGPW